MTEFANGHYARGTAAGRKGNIETGLLAAAKVNKTLGHRHTQLLAAWGHYGVFGAIPEEIASDLSLPVHIVRPRAGELVKRGLMFVVGKSPGELGCDVMRYSTIRPAHLDAAV